ncbi:hypothetical protein HII36_49890 [Nonomuraea sp. NN258]|uniref:hypothetical protein n=1 Tax=Nonomuraea antri TaxID=2730852 RepID=UPI00156952A4|nr:hypothetical protein [Nonomuraea antri]NRQ39890.1 hypothetical protein [Nonomuraea antri]
MDAVLPATLLTVLRDLHASCAVRPNVGEVAGGGGWDGPVVMLSAPDGTGMGVRIPRDGDLAEQLADVADQVQEWAVHALWMEGLPAVWPECPEHPGGHPLAAVVEGDTAVWACPRTRTVVAPVGSLPGSDASEGGSSPLRG